MISRLTATACLVIAQIAAASAQSPSTPPAPGRSTDCVPTQTSPDPNSITTTGRPGEALTDKLARSDGVLCPPAGVDPEIKAPTPDPGTSKMPVVPPPGSPGGDSGARPK